MKTKSLVTFIVLTSWLTSCEITDLSENMFALPQPCHVEAIYANVGRIIQNEQFGTFEISDIAESVEAEYFNISVLTFDSIVGWSGEYLGFLTGIGQGVIASEGAYCKESIPEVEQHIHDWAEKQNEESDPNWNISWKSATRTLCYHFPYRLEGVTAFTITANQPFCGIEAGQDITGCFIITDVNPELIFSYEDYAVCSRGNVTRSVPEWLALKPLAAPCMLLHLTDTAQRAADDIAFTITMKLTNGKVLTATTPMVSLM